MCINAITNCTLEGVASRPKERVSIDRRMTEVVTRDQWQALLDSVDTFLFDCSGRKDLEISAHIHRIEMGIPRY